VWHLSIHSGSELVGRSIPRPERHGGACLRRVLDVARSAESAAKTAGRDALQIAVCRRSGEHASALCPWEMSESLEQWVVAFQNDASDRWAYHLRAELPTLGMLEPDAIQAEIRRQIERSETTGKDAFNPQQIAERFAEYLRWRLSDDRRPKDREFIERLPSPEARDRELTRRALEGFITLCQSASFLARGRDE